jgi:hypothetical protein
VNRLLDTAREAFARGLVDWVGDTVVARLVRTSVAAPNFSTLAFLSELDDDGFAADAVEIENRTATAGVLDGDDVLFPAVDAGDAIDAVAIYVDTGNAATSRVLAWLDSGTGLPVTPDGTDVTVTWDPGASRIVRL